MAVYTPIDEERLRQMLGIYEGMGPLVGFQGIAAGSINSTFRVETEGAAYYLRINEGKAFAELVHERDLLLHLAAHRDALDGIETPVIVTNCIGGAFFPIVPGKYAALFRELSGRELGVFEVAPEHVAAVGAFLARAHQVLQSFSSSRANPFGLPVVTRWLAELAAAGVLPDVVARLSALVDAVRPTLAKPLPRGIVHGDLFINNTKWRRGRLSAVFDWEMAGVDVLIVDLAITALAWSWQRDTGDGASGLRPELVRALIDGYRGVRALEDVELDAFYDAARFAAARFAVTRIRDFEVGRERARDEDRAYLDYREYIARLDALEAMGPTRVRDVLVG